MNEKVTATWWREKEQGMISPEDPANEIEVEIYFDENERRFYIGGLRDDHVLAVPAGPFARAVASSL